jgi:hypothetical protein
VDRRTASPQSVVRPELAPAIGHEMNDVTPSRKRSRPDQRQNSRGSRLEGLLIPHPRIVNTSPAAGRSTFAAKQLCHILTPRCATYHRQPMHRLEPRSYIPDGPNRFFPVSRKLTATVTKGHTMQYRSGGTHPLRCDSTPLPETNNSKLTTHLRRPTSLGTHHPPRSAPSALKSHPKPGE